MGGNGLSDWILIYEANTDGFVCTPYHLLVWALFVSLFAKKVDSAVLATQAILE